MKSKSPEGRETLTSFNKNGLPTQVQIGSLKPVQFTYDGHGRLTQTLQNGNSNRFSYGTLGNLTSTTDALGQVTQFQYDKAGRVTKQVLPNSAAIHFSYDQAGRLKSIRPPGKKLHSFTYNLYDLVARYLPPALSSSVSGATIYSYSRDRETRVPFKSQTDQELI